MKCKIFLQRGITFLLLLLFASSLLAATPTETVQRVADNMIKALDQNQSRLKSNPAIIRRIVDKELLPYVDVNRMAGMVVGRDNWYKASPDERRLFVSLFKSSVINTYSDALSSYNDDRVQVYPLRSAANSSYVQVNSAIIRKGGQKIAISYNLVSSAGDWKIYDFSIEGVSIIANYRSQFAATLSHGGIKALNARLSRHNRRIE